MGQRMPVELRGLMPRHVRKIDKKVGRMKMHVQLPAHWHKGEAVWVSILRIT